MTKETIIVSIEDLNRYLNGMDLARGFGMAEWAKDERKRLTSLVEQLKAEVEAIEQDSLETDCLSAPEFCSICSAITGLCQEVHNCASAACRREKFDQLEERLADIRKAIAGLKSADSQKAESEYAGVAADDCGSPTSCLAVKIAGLDNTSPVDAGTPKMESGLPYVGPDALETPTGLLAEETVKINEASAKAGHKKNSPDERYLTEPPEPHENPRRASPGK